VFEGRLLLFAPGLGIPEAPLLAVALQLTGFAGTLANVIAPGALTSWTR